MLKYVINILMFTVLKLLQFQPNHRIKSNFMTSVIPLLNLHAQSPRSMDIFQSQNKSYMNTLETCLSMNSKKMFQTFVIARNIVRHVISKPSLREAISNSLEINSGWWIKTLFDPFFFYHICPE